MGSQLKMSFSREQNPVRTHTKPLKTKPRQHQGHFDPEELTRRLYLVLADQQAHAERKRARAKAEELAKQKEPTPWNIRQPNREAAERRSKEAAREKAARETVTAHSSQQTSLRPAVSTSSTELKRQKSSKLGAARKEPKATLAKEAPKPAPEPAPATYHHVPQEAAKQFQRTTTVDTMREAAASADLAHKLSKQALKLHLAAGAAAHSSSLRAVAAIEEKPTSPVEKLLKDRERVDHWRSHIPEDPIAEEAAEEEEREEYYVAPQYQQQHTFHAELARLRPPTNHPDHQHRRNSTGDILGKAAEDTRLSMVLVERTSLADVLEEVAPPPGEPDPVQADEHRVDWTQSDEQRAAAAAAAAAVAAAAVSAAGTNAAPAQRHKPLLSPLLRKADSIWTLRGRLGSGGKAQEKGDMPQISESPRSPKGSFFAKFKR